MRIADKSHYDLQILRAVPLVRGEVLLYNGRHQVTVF